MNTKHYWYIPLLLLAVSAFFLSCRDLVKPEGSSNTSVKIQIESFRTGGSRHWFSPQETGSRNVLANINESLQKISKTQTIDEVRLIVLDMSQFSDEESFLTYWQESNQYALWDTALFMQLASQNLDEYNIIVTLFKSYRGTAYSFKGDYGLQIEGDKARGTLYLNPGLNYIFYAFRSGGAMVEGSEMFFVVKENEENLLKLGSSVSGIWSGTWTDTTNSSKTGALRLNISQSGDSISGSFTISGVTCFSSGSITGDASRSSMSLTLTPAGYNGGIYMYGQMQNNNFTDIWFSYVQNCSSLPTYARVNLTYGESTTQVPAAPAPLTPSTGSAGVSESPTLTWTAVTGATSYSVQVSTSDVFSNPLQNYNGLTKTSLSLTGLAANTKYYWHVSAANSAGTSVWSQTFNFTTIPSSGTAPTAPSLVTPANNATAVLVPPTLTWSASAGATSYRLQISSTSSFTTLFYNDSTITTTSKEITTLGNGSLYYWRVNAKNSSGTSVYSNVYSFTTIPNGSPCPGLSTVTYLSKIYTTVQIGSQCWLRENLDVGSTVKGTVSQLNNSAIERYCYNDLAANCDTYGGLYQWNEAMQYVTTPGAKGICPAGWHIPTSAQLQSLVTAASSNSNNLKAVGQGSGAGAGTNASGFSALLAGYRSTSGNFINLAISTSYLSSTEFDATNANNLYLPANGSTTSLTNNQKDFGYSVRCLKD